MRFVMQVSFPPEQFNKFVLDGTIGKRMARILKEVGPEAAYFTSKDGKRGGTFIVNLEKTSDMAHHAEPFFLTFNAAVEFLPAMTPEDLEKAGLDEIGKKWK